MCTKCGYYRGRMVVDMKKKLDKKVAKAKTKATA
jgi:hypothetical protein